MNWDSDMQPLDEEFGPGADLEGGDVNRAVPRKYECFWNEWVTLDNADGLKQVFAYSVVLWGDGRATITTCDDRFDCPEELIVRRQKAGAWDLHDFARRSPGPNEVDC